MRGVYGKRGGVESSGDDGLLFYAKECHRRVEEEELGPKRWDGGGRNRRDEPLSYVSHDSEEKAPHGITRGGRPARVDPDPSWISRPGYIPAKGVEVSVYEYLKVVQRLYHERDSRPDQMTNRSNQACILVAKNTYTHTPGWV